MNNFTIRQLDFYTDGSSSTKTEMSGWACICVEDDAIIDTQVGYEPYSTNNRAELLGVLCALEVASTIESGHTDVNIHVDSAYIANCFNQGWYRAWLKNNAWKTSDKQDVKNKDLWTRILALYIKYKERFSINFIKVEGHSGNKYNDYVDLLAKKARKKLERAEEETK